MTLSFPLSLSQSCDEYLLIGEIGVRMGYHLDAARSRAKDEESSEPGDADGAGEVDRAGDACSGGG